MNQILGNERILNFTVAGRPDNLPQVNELNFVRNIQESPDSENTLEILVTDEGQGKDPLEFELFQDFIGGIVPIIPEKDHAIPYQTFDDVILAIVFEAGIPITRFDDLGGNLSRFRTTIPDV
ncbi:MAG: hypothetical protein WC824_12955 [Bacteroidota bacterium]|jgi:hypothetical protein